MRIIINPANNKMMTKSQDLFGNEEVTLKYDVSYDNDELVIIYEGEVMDIECFGPPKMIDYIKGEFIKWNTAVADSDRRVDEMYS